MRKSINLYWSDRAGIHRADMREDLNGALTLALSLQFQVLGLYVEQTLYHEGTRHEPERVFQVGEKFDAN